MQLAQNELYEYIYVYPDFLLFVSFFLHVRLERFSFWKRQWKGRAPWIVVCIVDEMLFCDTPFFVLHLEYCNTACRFCTVHHTMKHILTKGFFLQVWRKEK